MDIQNARFGSAGPLTVWEYWTRRVIPAVELTPFRIALAYTIFGAVALFISDVLLVWYLADPLLSQAQAVKGGVEVLLTAGFIFVLTTRRESQVQQTIHLLDQHREELVVLHRVLRHNLRNNLNVIQAHAEQIWDGKSPDDRSSSSKQLLAAVADLQECSEQADRIRKITESEGERQTQDASEIVRTVAVEHAQADSDVAVSTNSPDRAPVEANHMLKDAVAELVTNAIVHNDSESPMVTIEVSEEASQSHMVTITVADNGPGIPDPQIEPLEAGTEGQLLHLDGVGLWFVKWVVHHSRGELTFEQNNADGTVVTISVPKAPEELSASLMN